MPKTDKDGNMEFHPIELPRDYVCGADPENPFKRVEEKEIISKRKCGCGKEFILHVVFDKNNPLHKICDDCLQKEPLNPNQRYPDQFIQAYASDAGEQIGSEE